MDTTYYLIFKLLSGDRWSDIVVREEGDFKEISGDNLRQKPIIIIIIIVIFIMIIIINIIVITIILILIIVIVIIVS